MRGLRVWAKRAKLAKRAKQAKLAERRVQWAIIAAALGFASWGVWGVGETCGVGSVGASAFADETSKARPVGVVANEKPARGTAFIVGADDYAEASDLQCVRNDVDALTERLVEIGFERENITTLKTGGDFDRFPTKENIEKYFASFVETLREGDFVVVYLSGHGIQPESSKETFFAPIDVKARDPFATSVSIDAMLKKLENSKARFRWVIVDACRNDPTAPNKGIFNVKMSGVRNLTDFADAPDSVAVFRSCGPGECSYEGEKNGVFTQSLLEALDKKNAKADADGDGALMFTEVLQYVTKRTKELAYKNHRGASQRPTLDGSASDFVLLDDFGGGGTFWAALILSTLACGAAGVAVLFRRKAAATVAPVSTPVVVPSEPSSSWEPDAEDASRKTWEDADKLASEAWTAFDLGGVANVEKAIRLMKESLALVELAANRRALKTFEGELLALCKARAEEKRKKREAEERAAKRRADAYKLAGEALAAFDLGGFANVEKAIKLMKESLALFDFSVNRRALKTFEEKLESLRKASVAAQASLPEDYLAASGIKFRLIRPGSFMMGNTLTPEEIHKKYPGGKLEWYQDAPPHKVTLTKPFYLAKYATTVGEFKRFVDATGYKTTAEREGNARGFKKEDGTWGDVAGWNWRNPGIKQDSTHPVVCVSWDDAQRYIAWLNENAEYSSELGFKPVYRLPSEAEWEYACRAGTETEFFWGTNEPADGEGCLNAADETGAPDGGKWSYPFPFKSGYTATSPVGKFQPNAWGLYDMLGNVWEWCADWYDGNYYEKTNNAQNPINVTPGSSRVLRGGSWDGDAKYCRSAGRGLSVPTDRDHYYGFRLALVREL